MALEEFLSEFLPIFAPTPTEHPGIGESAPGGWLSFVREYTFVDEAFPDWEQTGFYVVDSVMGEAADLDAVPYAFTEQLEFEYEMWTATYIATGFHLYDIDGDGIPAVLIWWYPLGGHFMNVQMFRYIEGRYTPMRVSVKHFWNLDEVVDTPFLFSTALFSGVSELLARDSEGRTITLGIGGAGGFETLAYVLHMDEDSIRLDPFFRIRFDHEREGPDGWEEEGFRIYVDESITGEHISFPEMDWENAMFFPWEWTNGMGDMTPVSIPIIPHVTVAPFPRMTTLEQQLTERITAQLLAEGRILP